MTDLTDEQREAYAKPGTFLRKMIDEGVVDWPTVEDLAHEEAMLAILRGEPVTIGDVSARMEPATDGPRSPQDARYGDGSPSPVPLSSHDGTDAPNHEKRK